MFKIDFHPTLDDYNYIHSWMEDAKSRQLVNWRLINNLSEENFKKGQVIVYRKDQNAEAFINVVFDQKILKLLVMSINPKYYHQGVGSRFLNDLFKYCKRKGIVVCEAYKPSHKGLRLVNKFDFFKKEYGHTGYNDWRVKFLVEHRKQNWTAKCRLVLWNTFDTTVKPIKSWSLNASPKSKPILTYAFYDWQIGIVENGQIVFSDKVKYYPIICDCVGDDYLYMTYRDITRLIRWKSMNFK